jgi:hypothetical protein
MWTLLHFETDVRDDAARADLSAFTKTCAACSIQPEGFARRAMSGEVACGNHAAVTSYLRRNRLRYLSIITGKVSSVSGCGFPAGGDYFRPHLATGSGQLVVLLGQDRSGEPDDGVSGREDARDVGPPADLLVEPFLGLSNQIWRQTPQRMAVKAGCGRGLRPGSTTSTLPHRCAHRPCHSEVGSGPRSGWLRCCRRLLPLTFSARAGVKEALDGLADR